jgi:hypothetical protein
LIQSNNWPVGSPPRTSSGNPCRRALPKFVRSRSREKDENIPGEKLVYRQAKRYSRQVIGRIRLSNFRTSLLSSKALSSLGCEPDSETGSSFSFRSLVILESYFIQAIECEGRGVKLQREALIRYRPITRTSTHQCISDLRLPRLENGPRESCDHM